MSEESMLILNMLREGKISAEQADSLLRAVRVPGTAGPTPPTPPSAPTPPPSDPASMAAMQNKIGELQGKLGELQGKLGAAQAFSLAGKVLDHIHRPDVDMSKINKVVDETMRGLYSFKNEAVKTARAAARQAGQEAKRSARQGRKSMKFEFHIDLKDGNDSDRPANGESQPEATETSRNEIAWNGAEKIILTNAYGNVRLTGSEAPDAAVEASVTKTAWAESDAAARVVLQQVFLTHQLENGQLKIGVAAPQDAKNRLTVDYEVRVPRHLPVEVETIFGEIQAARTGVALAARSETGGILAEQPEGEVAGETSLRSQSGEIRIQNWTAPAGMVTAATASGDILADALHVGGSIILSSRSGDVCVQQMQAGGAATFETASGEISISDGSAGARLQVKTQSGQASLHRLRAEQVHVETVSGDAELQEVAGVLSVKTVSGDVNTKQIQSEAVSLVTVSGDTEWAFAAPFSGSFAGTTVSGDLALALWTNSDARVEMNTTNGDLVCGLSLEEKSPASDRHLSGKLGSGIGSIRLQSVSGDLKIAGVK